MPLQRIAVLGLGKVGALAAKLLHHGGFDVTGFDSRTLPETMPFAVQGADLVSDDGVRAATHGFDAVLSCLPYRINRRIATAAHARGMHYFDLTEDVSTTQAIIDLSKTARGLMAPQCGLAPGFVGIVGAAQVAAFEECRSLRLRVGALPQHPTGLMGYAFNWSPEGRGQRIPERLRSDRRRRAQDGVVDGVARDVVCGRRHAGSLHDVGRARARSAKRFTGRSPTSTTRPCAIPDTCA